MKFKQLKGFVVGFTCCALFTTGVAYAAGGTQIEVFYKNLKYMIDGTEKRPSEGQGFIYDGTTYVPLRFIGEALGKEVSWDASTETIWVGKKEGAFKNLTEIDYARMDGVAKTKLSFNEWKYPAGLKFKIAGHEFYNGLGIVLDEYYFYEDSVGSIDYNLNGEYVKLSGKIGVDDNTKSSDNTGTVVIIGDGKELYRKSNLRGGDNPAPVEVDLKGVLKLQIKFEAQDNKSRDEGKINIGFVDVKLY
ncbi:NPCBM/NEW2 domain-containing protein [Paenibacillus sp. YYML68]|uniref:NPCBM/NEW2 domain-containing protein n=1 Tax=Paenibacillus sp. YYML68 TaxID=2909250 RepID=UPI0024920DD3|nr:NPCBM/NEW2 domain-containing protein [Paenibacillus sp. YYML68]